MTLITIALLPTMSRMYWESAANDRYLPPDAWRTFWLAVLMFPVLLRVCWRLAAKNQK